MNSITDALLKLIKLEQQYVGNQSGVCLQLVAVQLFRCCITSVVFQFVLQHEFEHLFSK